MAGCRLSSMFSSWRGCIGKLKIRVQGETFALLLFIGRRKSAPWFISSNLGTESSHKAIHIQVGKVFATSEKTNTSLRQGGSPAHLKGQWTSERDIKFENKHQITAQCTLATWDSECNTILHCARWRLDRLAHNTSGAGRTQRQAGV
jgi:hypothetical protein